MLLQGQGEATLLFCAFCCGLTTTYIFLVSSLIEWYISCPHFHYGSAPEATSKKRNVVRQVNFATLFLAQSSPLKIICILLRNETISIRLGQVECVLSIWEISSNREVPSILDKEKGSVLFTHSVKPRHEY